VGAVVAVGGVVGATVVAVCMRLLLVLHLLLFVHHAALHVFLELLYVLAQLRGRLVDYAADDGVDLTVPRSALRQ